MLICFRAPQGEAEHQGVLTGSQCTCSMNTGELIYSSFSEQLQGNVALLY